MTTLTRWKLAAALFAAIAGVTYLRSRGDSRDVPAQMTEAPRGAMPIVLRRPIRVTADAAGMSPERRRANKP